MKTRKTGNVRPVDPNQALPTKPHAVSLTGVVSLVDLKEFARKLPATYGARELILEMDDSMPRWMALGRLDIIAKIVEDEFKTT